MQSGDWIPLAHNVEFDGEVGVVKATPITGTDELWLKAQQLHLDDNLVEAEEIYCTLLEQNHNNIGLMATLGSLYLQAGRHGLSIHFLEAAIKNGFTDPDIYTNLGIAYKNASQVVKARELFQKSIEKNPTPEALTNYSAMFIECGESKKCAQLCEQAISMKFDLPIAHWNLSISLLGDGIWDRGWDEYDWGLKAHHVREDRKVLDVPMWDGTPGKTVLLYGEQGMGDEIMFASMIPDLLKTNKIVLESNKRLATLFKKSFPEIEVYGTREDKEVNWSLNHHIDYRLPIGSLGKFYRRNRESFPGSPFLKADPLEKNGKFRIGISWQGGGAKVGRVMKRSIPLTWWKPILDYKNVEFVSLQYTQSKEGLDIMDALGYDIKRMDEYAQAEDYYETARLVASCDLIITVNTSIVHLAGSLGIPCWVMTPKYPAWRYQNSGSMPWYRSVSLYRQPSIEKEAWIPVIDKIASHLGELLNLERARKYA